MNLLWTGNAWEEYQYWQSVDQSMVEKINELIRDTKRSPFKGLGKPEPLKGSLSGFWSRRILGEHRLVYCVSGKGSTQQLQIIHAEELSPPEGRAPILWKLITNLPVTTHSDAVHKLDWYALRWKIETFFRTLKTGC